MKGFISSHTDKEVVTLISWDNIASHENFKTSPEYGTLMAELVKMAPKSEKFHVQL